MQFYNIFKGSSIFGLQCCVSYIKSWRIQDYKVTSILNHGAYKITELLLCIKPWRIQDYRVTSILNHGAYKVKKKCRGFQYFQKQNFVKGNFLKIREYKITELSVYYIIENTRLQIYHYLKQWRIQDYRIISISRSIQNYRIIIIFKPWKIQEYRFTRKLLQKNTKLHNFKIM